MFLLAVVDGEDMSKYDNVDCDDLQEKDDNATLEQLEWELASQSGRVTGNSRHCNNRPTTCLYLYLVSMSLFLLLLLLLLRKEGNVLFNDTLNTFYLWLYGVGHIVKNHSDREKGNWLSPHRLLFPISSKGSFICTMPQTG